MELINNNQVPEGYKKTEIGVIPEDWLCLNLGDLFSFKNGLNKSKNFFGNGTPIVNYMDVFQHPGLYKSDILGKVTVSNDEIRAYGVRKGDVFFTRTSETVEEIGMAAVLLENIDNCVFSGFVLRGRPKNSDYDLNLIFKKYCFNSEIVRKQVTSTSSYTTRALTNGKLLSQVILPCPPTLPEQKAIAQTLSDVDALIATLDQLIAKKRHIKTATMQQLLTGKTRLPGFGEGKGYKKSAIGVIPEDWEVDDLGKFITEFRGGAPLKPSDFTNGGVKVLPKGAVVRGGFLKINDKDLQFCSKQYANLYGKNKINNSYIVVVLRDLVPSGPSIGLIVKIKEPEIYILAQGVYGFKTQGIIDEYLIQYSNSFPYRRLMNEIMVGSTQVHITNTAFKAIKLPFPPLPEQKAIAQVLSDIDTEIAALEKRRAKTQAIKQGMMQELLTGKTRITNN